MLSATPVPVPQNPSLSSSSSSSFFFFFFFFLLLLQPSLLARRTSSFPKLRRAAFLKTTAILSMIEV
jgi:hypothetical protein